MKINYTAFPSIIKQKRTGLHREILLAVLSAICLFSIAHWGGDEKYPYPRILTFTLQPMRFVLSTIVSTGNRVEDSTSRFFDLGERVVDLEKEVTHLKEEIAEAHQRESQLRLAQPDLANVQTIKIESVRSTVVGVGSADFKSLILDKGLNDGLNLNMPVYAGDGLVGRIDRVLPNASRVMLLQDQNSRVGAEIRSVSGELLADGLVFGTGSTLDDTLRLEAEGQSIKLQGALVYTSSLSDFYPPGLKIGQVERIVPGIAQVFERYVIRSSVQVRSLRQVLVIINLNRGDALTMINEERPSQ